MRTSHPPVVATWLLEHLRSGNGNEPLTGDLMEEYRHGRSGAWYWRQSLVAILVSFCKEVRAHPLFAMKALATGWAIWLFSQSLVQPLLDRLLLPWGYQVPLVFGYSAPIGIGWWIIWLSVRFGSGWIVARTNRTHAIGMVLAFSASVLIWKLQRLPWTFHLLLDTSDNPRYFPQLIFELMSMFLPSACIVLGGLLASPMKREPLTQTLRITS